MPFRESNAFHLEILEAAFAEGVPIEVDIFDGASPATLLETLENAKDVTFQEELSRPGSGSFRINRHDPKATSAVVDRENLAKIKVGGIYRFAFWMRERRIEVLQEGEEEAEYWTIGGPGTLAYLDRAEMWTESYIGTDPREGVWDLGLAGTGNAVGQMAYRVLQESLAKSPSPIGAVTTNWDYDADSQGAVWSDSADLEVNVGDNLLDVYELFRGLGLDYRMRHDLLLEAFVELGRHFDVASSPVRPVVFRGGQNVTTSLSRRSQGGLASRVLVKGSGDLIVQVVRPDIEADPYVGRREIFLSVSNAKDATTMQRAGEAELAGRLLDNEAISFGVSHGSGPGEYEPYVDYAVGDWITLDEPGVYDLASYRIVGWTIKQAEDDYEIYLDCNSIELEALLKIARKAGLDKAGGSTGGSSTVQGGSGGSGGGGTSSSAKVAVATGDTPGYLYDKIEEGAGIAKALIGPTGSRKVELSVGVLPLDALSDVAAPSPVEGDFLQRVGGLWVPGPAPGGFDPRYATRIFDECFYRGTSSILDGDIAQQIAGTSAAVAPSSIAAPTHPGVVSMSTGSTATGFAGLGSTGTPAAGVVLGAGQEVRFGAYVLVPTLSDGTHTFVLRLGLVDSYNSTAGPNEVVFRYSHSQNGGRWQGVCRAANVESVLDTGVAATTGWTRLEYVITGASSVAFFIDGASVGSVSTNIPTAGLTLLPASIRKTLGATARSISLDWYRYEFVWAGGRW